MRRLNFVLAGILLATTGAAVAQTAAAVADTHRPAEDTAHDAARHPAAMIDFAHIGHGSKVVDFIPGHGYFTRLFAVAVKPGGSVVAVVPTAAAGHDPAGAAMITALGSDAAYGDITVINAVTDAAAANADVFWTAQNYHDLHNAAPGTVAGLNKAVFAALKAGGYYVIVDHVALAGSGDTATKSLHRIDSAMVKAEVTAAGFVFDGESKVLANPADPHTAVVFDPAIRGKTDQFAYRFKKPG